MNKKSWTYAGCNILHTLSLFVSVDDAMEVHGAEQWLIKAYEDYRNRVINNQIGYKAYMEEFHVRLSMPIFFNDRVSFHELLKEATDRDKVKHILENRKFTEKHFSSPVFDESDAIKMIANYNAIGIKAIPNVLNERPPIMDYPQKVKEGLAHVVNKYQMLIPDISSEDLTLLLSTGTPSRKYMIPPYSRNVDLGLFIHILFSVGALNRTWSSTISKPEMLLTSSGKKMQRGNISAAVHRFDGYKLNHLDYRQRDIVQDVLPVLSSMPNLVQKLKLLF